MRNPLRRRGWAPLVVVHSNLWNGLGDREFERGLEALLADGPALAGLNEAGRGDRPAILRRFARENGLHLRQGRGSTSERNLVLLADAGRFQVVEEGCEPIHGDPPGVASQRFVLWWILFDRESRRYLVHAVTHWLPAVERSYGLNRIPRSRYWVRGVAATIRLVRRLRRKCRRIHGRGGAPAIVQGDLNWSWSGGSLVERLAGAYFRSNHRELGMARTHGRRAIDAVMARGRGLRFAGQRTSAQPGDHRRLTVRMLVRRHR